MERVLLWVIIGINIVVECLDFCKGWLGMGCSGGVLWKWVKNLVFCKGGF